MRAAALALLLALAAPVPAQEQPPAAAAEAAARRLEEAQALLARAEGAEDRLAALGSALRAFEDGLALLREALRDVAADRAAIESELLADREALAQLLGALQSMGASPEAALLLHPDGPLATARAGLLLSDVTPALAAEAEALREGLGRLSALQAEQEEALGTLREGLAAVQEARADLAAAAATREELPRAFAEDPVATALLMASAASLEEFAANLDETVEAPLGQAPDAPAPAEALPLPVAGAVLRRAGEADAAGVARPGVVIATEPRALVTVPVASTLRFRGPLLDLGTVAILEPAPGTLIVVAGLGQVWGEAGEILPPGAPLGLMGGETPPADAVLTGVPPEGTGGRTETLYLEVRENGVPVDPSAWFRLD